MTTLQESQIRQFREQGSLAVEGFFSHREVQAMRADIQRLQAIGKLRNVATAGDGKTPTDQRVNLQLCPLYQDSDLFRALPFEAKVVQAVGQLIGNPFLLHLDQVFLKPPRRGMGTAWHQDNAYFNIPDPLKGTAMWIAVHDATAANGTMRVIPAVFREKLEHHRDPNSDHHIRCYPDEKRAVTYELAAGGVLFFCYGTPHCTGPNLTNQERAGVAYHFLHVDCRASAHQVRSENYHPILSGPQASDGTKEYGLRVAGSFPHEVDRLLQPTPR